MLVAAFVFGTLHANRLEGRVVSLNGRGNGALQKIGGSTEAVLSRALGRDGVYHEQLLWALIADEWQSQRTALRPRYSAEEARGRVRRAADEVRTQFRLNAPPHSLWTKELYPFFITGHHAVQRPAHSPTHKLRPVRVPTPAIEVQLGTAFGRLLNISATGALLQTDKEMGVGRECALMLNMLTGPISTTVRIVRAKPTSVALQTAISERRGCLVGVAFTELQTKAKQTVADLCGASYVKRE